MNESLDNALQELDQGCVVIKVRFALKLTLCGYQVHFRLDLDPLAPPDTGARAAAATGTGEQVLHPFTGQRMATDTAQMFDQPCIVARYIALFNSTVVADISWTTIKYNGLA